MKTRTSMATIVGCAVVMLFMTAPVAADDPCSKCGWEPYWVDTCLPDYDEIPESAVTIGIDLSDDCIPETDMVFTGGFTVWRDPPFAGLIVMEISSMVLTAGDGTTLTAGAGLGQGGVLQASPGAIQQTTPDEADAFFDVYFELEISGEGVYGYNHEPLRLAAVEPLHCVPPDVVFAAAPETCLPIYDTPQPPGEVIGRVTFSGDFIPPEHDPYREEEPKWEQLPDLSPTGLDVAASWCWTCHEEQMVPPPWGNVLADDFECRTTGPLTEIRVWGSWLSDLLPNGDPAAVDFTLSIHKDIPDPDPNNPEDYSMPGEILWIGSPPFYVTLYADQLEEGWYDPYFDSHSPPPLGDTECYEYVFSLDACDTFIQQGKPGEPVVYWLDVQAYPHNEEAWFGWKTSLDHWNDDAVWGTDMDPPPWWDELRYPADHPYAGESIDLAFAIYGDDLYSKWLQVPHGPYEGFDEASDYWWNEGGEPSKWEQLPNEGLSGLHCDDWATPDYGWLTCADDFLCEEGGEIVQVEWWGNYENENPGSGINHFHLSLHECTMGPQGFCVPFEPALWVATVPLAAANETDSGLTNNMGETIYHYSYTLPDPYTQYAGTYYWFDVGARFNDPSVWAVWRWQEANRSGAFWGHAPAAEDPSGTGWRSIIWTDPTEYSDFAFRIISSGLARSPSGNESSGAATSDRFSLSESTVPENVEAVRVLGSDIASLTKPTDSVPTEAGGSRQDMECPADALFDQPPHWPAESWSAATSDVNPGYLVYENYSGVNGPICDIHFWGLNAYQPGTGWVPCDENPMTFEIKFYTDAAGTPGAEVCSYTLSIPGMPTGQLYSGFELYEYSADLDPCCVLDSGWVSIQGINSDPNCWFLWMSSSVGDGDSLQDDGTGTLVSTGYDRALCLTPGEEVNKVVADDFQSDGRPINVVHWWGSYLDYHYSPDFGPEEPYVIDGWFVSFHHDQVQNPGCPPDLMADPHPTVVGVYFCPTEAVEIIPTGYDDCLDHRVYEYKADLSCCCLLCSEFDPRTGTYAAQPEAFYEEEDLWYWLDIQAVVGVTWYPPWCDYEDRILTGHIPSDLTADRHFWGWHTSPDENRYDACTGKIFDWTPYPPNCWDYGAWDVPWWQCDTPEQPINMAFELLTAQQPPFNPPLRCEDYPNNFRMNRFVCFEPNNPNIPVAFEFELTATGPAECYKHCDTNSPPDLVNKSCDTDVDCQDAQHPGGACIGDPTGDVGLTWWVTEPVCTDCDGQPVAGAPPCVYSPAVQRYEIWRSELTTVPQAARLWTESPVFIGDCEIIPQATYDGRATATPPGGPFSADEVFYTILRPGDKCWGDVVGEWTGAVWTPPNQVVNMTDIMAAVFFFQHAPNEPFKPWVEVDDQGPNMVVNFGDIQQLVLAFKGAPYPFSNPGACPPEPGP